MRDSSMRFGYTIPGDGTYERPEAWKETGRTAEENGSDTLWTGSHITIPEELDYEEY